MPHALKAISLDLKITLQKEMSPVQIWYLMRWRAFSLDLKVVFETGEWLLPSLASQKFMFFKCLDLIHWEHREEVSSILNIKYW